jgi:hypothetical protein
LHRNPVSPESGRDFLRLFFTHSTSEKEAL